MLLVWGNLFSEVKHTYTHILLKLSLRKSSYDACQCYKNETIYWPMLFRTMETKIRPISVSYLFVLMCKRLCCTVTKNIMFLLFYLNSVKFKMVPLDCSPELWWVLEIVV